MKTFKQFVVSKPHGYFEVKHGGCVAQVNDRKNHIEIEHITTRQKDRGKGHANHVMKIITKHADQVKKSITLQASPDKEKHRSKLYGFYEKHGFEHDNTWHNSGDMKRSPR